MNNITLTDMPAFRLDEEYLGDFRGRLNSIFPKELMGESKIIQLLFNFEFYPDEERVIEKTQPMNYSTKPGTPYHDFMTLLLHDTGYEEIRLEELLGIEGVLTIEEKEYQGTIYQNVIRFIPDMQEIDDNNGEII